MIRNYFWVIHITIKKIIKGNIQPAQMTQERPLKVPENALT